MPAGAVSPLTASAADISSGSDSDFVRLHITPLDPELLKIIVPAAAAPKARNISYHSIETFPEKRYGFVELPVMEAEKIKRRLNGSVLKGVKVRIEKARPEEIVEPTGDLDKEEKKKKKKKKSKEDGESSKKRKRDPELIEGVVLKDRKVKRGWTEAGEHKKKKSKKDKDKDKDGATTEKKKRLKSKYTDQEECLLKTKVPPNAVANITGDDVPKKRKKKGKSREVTVHEFEKTTKFPSFLKNSVSESDSKPATEFVEGKGWVDEDGNVVEAVKDKPTPTPNPAKAKPAAEKKKKQEVVEEDDDDATSSSGTSSSGTSSDEEESEDEEVAREDSPAPQKEASPLLPEHATPLSAFKADDSRPISSSSSRSLTIKIPPPITPSTTKVHPLEALYKRSKPEDAAETPAQEAEPFNFFDLGNDDDIEEDDAVPATTAPLTPFTRQDLEWRTTRSAAPTPDTAHPSRVHHFMALSAAADEDEEEDDDMDDAQDEADEGQQAPADGPGSTDFQSWFWENRGDLNRSWMKRRKTAAKEKRHRENKARASRAV